MQKIFVATDRNGKAYTYTNKPVWQDSTGTFAGHWRFVDCDPSFAPPPGECREYRLVPVEEANAKDSRIAELEKQLDDRSPGVMPDEVNQIIGDLRESVANLSLSPGRLDSVCDELEAYYAPPDGHEWQPVDDEHPVTAEDVGRKVAHRNGGVDKVGKVKDVPGVYRLIVGEHAYAVNGRVWCGKKSTADITHILRPIAPPFVFDGTPGAYETDIGDIAHVVACGRGTLVVLNGGTWQCVLRDGTFDGGRITRRVE